MSYVSVYSALATFLASTLILIVYFRGSGTKLETRLNKIIEEKKLIITKSYLEVAEKIVDRFKIQRTLSDELEEELEEVSRIRFRLNNYLPDELKEIVRKLTYSLGYGFTSAFLMIIFAYIPSLNYEPTMSFWFQLIVFSFMILSLAKYLQEGIFKIRSLRNLEEIVNDIERCKRLNHLQELL